LKLVRIIEDPSVLYTRDTLVVNVTINYDTEIFGGDKFLIVADATWAGGQEWFLGVGYAIMAGVWAVLSAVSCWRSKANAPRLRRPDQLLASEVVME